MFTLYYTFVKGNYYARNSRSKGGEVVVRNVPAMICSQCSEEWIDAVTAKKLEKMVDMAKKNKLQIEMVEFAEVA